MVKQLFKNPTLSLYFLLPREKLPPELCGILLFQFIQKDRSVEVP